MNSDVETDVVKPKQGKISSLFYSIIGWPLIDIEHDKAVKAIRIFMLFGEILLVYQSHSKPPTKGFTYFSFTIDLFIFISAIRLICCALTDDQVTLTYLGDTFCGLKNEYELRLLGLCGVFCLGGFRTITCYLARNGSLDWLKIVDKAMINGWKPEELNMKESYCLKWRQVSVFLARQIVGATIIMNAIWLTCLIYLIISCKTFYLALQNSSIPTLFIFWQIISLITIIWVVPQCSWIALVYGIAFFYVINRSDSVYSDLQTKSKLKPLTFLALRGLCYQNIKLLNEFDYINRSMRYIGYFGSNLMSIAGQVAMLYSYFKLFGMPLADFGLGFIGFNTVFQIGVMSLIAAKSASKIGSSYSHFHTIYKNNYFIEPRLKLKVFHNIDRLSSPFTGFWVGESYLNDKYSFIQYLFETCSNMMLIVVTMANLMVRNNANFRLSQL